MRHDVIVIGAGHNGLVAATLLARAGLDVRVVEERDVVGGAARTETPFAKVPGLRQSTGAILLGLMPPELIRLLGSTYLCCAATRTTSSPRPARGTCRSAPTPMRRTGSWNGSSLPPTCAPTRRCRPSSPRFATTWRPPGSPSRSPSRTPPNVTSGPRCDRPSSTCAAARSPPISTGSVSPASCCRRCTS